MCDVCGEDPDFNRVREASLCVLMYVTSKTFATKTRGKMVVYAEVYLVTTSSVLYPCPPLMQELETRRSEIRQQLASVQALQVNYFTTRTLDYFFLDLRKNNFQLFSGESWAFGKVLEHIAWKRSASKMSSCLRDSSFGIGLKSA